MAHYARHQNRDTLRGGALSGYLYLGFRTIILLGLIVMAFVYAFWNWPSPLISEKDELQSAKHMDPQTIDSHRTREDETEGRTTVDFENIWKPETRTDGSIEVGLSTEVLSPQDDLPKEPKTLGVVTENPSDDPVDNKGTGDSTTKSNFKELGNSDQQKEDKPDSLQNKKLVVGTTVSSIAKDENALAQQSSDSQSNIASFTVGSEGNQEKFILSTTATVVEDILNNESADSLDTGGSVTITSDLEDVLNGQSNVSDTLPNVLDTTQTVQPVPDKPDEAASVADMADDSLRPGQVLQKTAEIKDEANKNAFGQNIADSSSVLKPTSATDDQINVLTTKESETVVQPQLFSEKRSLKEQQDVNNPGHNSVKGLANSIISDTNTNTVQLPSNSKGYVDSNIVLEEGPIPEQNVTNDYRNVVVEDFNNRPNDGSTGGLINSIINDEKTDTIQSPSNSKEFVSNDALQEGPNQKEHVIIDRDVIVEESVQQESKIIVPHEKQNSVGENDPSHNAEYRDGQTQQNEINVVFENNRKTPPQFNSLGNSAKDKEQSKSGVEASASNLNNADGGLADDAPNVAKQLFPQSGQSPSKTSADGDLVDKAPNITKQRRLGRQSQSNNTSVVKPEESRLKTILRNTAANGSETVRDLNNRVPSAQCFNSSFLVYTCVSNTMCGGFANRQHGMVTIYLLARMLKRRFAILHEKPCPLSNYLDVNTYDWNSCSHTFKIDNNTHIHKFIDNFQFTRQVPTFDFQGLFKDKVSYILSNRFWEKQLLQRPGAKINLEEYVNKTHYEIYRTVLSELFKPKQQLQGDVNSFMSKYQGHGRRLVCAHIRIGQTPLLKQEPSLMSDPEPIFKFLDTFNDNKTNIFVATDYIKVKETARKRYGSNFVTVNGKLAHVDKFVNREDACEGLYTVLLDQMILSRCDTQILVNSGVSTSAAYMRPKLTTMYCYIKERKTFIKCTQEDLYGLYFMHGSRV